MPAPQRPDPDAPRRGREFDLTWLRIVGAALIVATILSASGAFGTGGLAVIPRTAYWIGLTAAGTAMGILGARRLIPRRLFDTRLWLAWLVVVALICVPMTVVVFLSDAVVVGRPMRMSLLLEMFPPTLATTAAITGLAFLIRHRMPAETHAGSAGAPPPRFLERLPARLKGAELWAVEAQDHYLRLHTSLGQDLVLMRLGDAIVELEGIEGARTHRSWWVARASVKAVERSEGRATLTLPDGAEAPVSRAYLKSLREAGWF